MIIDFNSTKERKLLGIFLILFGIAITIITYKYVIPLGSIIAIVWGLIILFKWEWLMNFFKRIA